VANEHDPLVPHREPAHPVAPPAPQHPPAIPAAALPLAPAITLLGPRAGRQRGNGPAGAAALLQVQRTLGNRAARHLVQRVVSYGGRIANPRDDNEYDDLDPMEQPVADTLIDDQTRQYDFAGASEFFDYVRGNPDITPTVTPISAHELHEAKKRKNRAAFNLNTESESPLTDIKGFHDLPRGQLPVWKPMGGPDNLVFTRNKHTKKHELRSRTEGQSKQNTARKRKLSVTVYEEKGSGKVHWHANVGDDLASSYTDTDITSRPTGAERNSQMGGFSSSKGDFKDTATDETLTIGHSSAYKDTIQQIKKKQRTGLDTTKIITESHPKTTDQEPRAFTPEQRDIGQHGRRTQIETKVRKYKGRYMEANELGSSTREVKTGRKIPEKKHYMRLNQDASFGSYAIFDQNAPVKSQKDKAGGWNQYWDQEAKGKKAEDFPQEEYYDSSEDEEWPTALDAPPTPSYLDRFREEDRYYSTTPLAEGAEVVHKGEIWTVVSATGTTTTAGAEYLISRTLED